MYRYINTHNHTLLCVYTHQRYRLIFFSPPISNTKVEGFGSTHRKRRFLREQAIGPGSFERVIIVKCQVNSEGLSSSNWEQISADGDIFNTGLPGQSETAGISQIPSLICLLTERSVSAHCFSFKMCFFFPLIFFFLFMAAVCRKSGPFYQRIKHSASKTHFLRVNFIHFQDHFYLFLSAEDTVGTCTHCIF